MFITKNVGARQPASNTQRKNIRRDEGRAHGQANYRTEANPGETLYVSVPKLNENEVIVPGSLALRFDIDLSGGHADNFLFRTSRGRLWTSWL